MTDICIPLSPKSGNSIKISNDKISKQYYQKSNKHLIYHNLDALPLI